MKCMSCLGLVVRLNSFKGFNLAHTKDEAINGFSVTTAKQNT